MDRSTAAIGKGMDTAGCKWMFLRSSLLEPVQVEVMVLVLEDTREFDK